MDNKDEINENSIKLKKFDKVFELMKIFYDLDINKEELKEINSSSFCFLGGGLKVKFAKNISLKDCQFQIRINLLSKNYFTYSKNFILFRTDKIKLEYDTAKINEYMEQIKNIQINLTFYDKKISLKIIDGENNGILELVEDREIKIINSFYLLENFYGQIKSIEFETLINNNSKRKDSSVLINEIFEPYLLSDDGYLCHRDNHKFRQINDCIDDNGMISIIKMNVINNKLFKSNYINYLDENFDFIEYYGGITPFVPFIPLINGINEKSEINVINNISNVEYFKKCFYEFLLLFFKILNKYKKNIKI
jgi:hypothetical protein